MAGTGARRKDDQAAFAVAAVIAYLRLLLPGLLRYRKRFSRSTEAGASHVGR